MAHRHSLLCGRVQEVLQADAGEQLGADAVGHHANLFRSVVGRVDVAAEEPSPLGQGDDAGDLVGDLSDACVLRPKTAKGWRVSRFKAPASASSSQSCRKASGVSSALMHLPARGSRSSGKPDIRSGRLRRVLNQRCRLRRTLQRQSGSFVATHENGLMWRKTWTFA